MKNQLCIFGMALSLVACTKETPVDYALLSGKIDNLNATELTLAKNDRTFTKKIPVNADGSFSDTIKSRPGVYTLVAGKNRTTVHLDNGNDLNIKANAEDFKKSLDVTGKGAEITRYLHFKNQKTAELKGAGTTFYTLEEEDFKNKNQEINTVLASVLDTFKGIPASYKSAEKRNLNYAKLIELSKYEMYHKYYAKKPDFKVSPDFLAELETLDVNNEADFIFSAAYKELVKEHYNKKIIEVAEKDSIDRSFAAVKVYATIPNQTIKNNLLFTGAQTGISYTENLEEYYQEYMNASTDEANNAKITEIYNKLKKVVKGQPSPKFTNYENNAGGTLSLDDLKGKYTYIDVWATWCGPCRAEIPHLKRVEKQYHGKNINFLSLSIDNPKDHDKWKKMIVDEELGGIQVLADNAWESQFVQDYYIRGIPRFILLDPDGIIVTPNAPRPSNPELITLFNELNI
ncbi:TlpA family protein disulfide reductase [Flavobacteriaceae bacterium F08102]|nr:TlpA family protein disulfide reductase [Flavobacteriaceae bacterium F08102]